MASVNGSAGSIGHVDGLVLAGGLVRVEDQRHLRQARDGAHPGLLQGGRQFQGDHLRPFAQDRLAHFDGELQAARHHRKVGEAAALQAAGDQEVGRSISPGIAQGFLSQHLDDGDFERLGLVGPLGGQALQLDGEAGHVDAVAHGVALVGGVRHLQEIRHVVQDALFGEGQVLLAGCDTPRRAPGNR